VHQLAKANGKKTSLVLSAWKQKLLFAPIANKLPAAAKTQGAQTLDAINSRSQNNSNKDVFRRHKFIAAP